jgi:MarR family transcriptional regulator for hemolysin
VKNLEDQFATALHQCSRAWRIKLNAHLSVTGVCHAGWMVIAIVAQSPRPLSQKSLSDQLAVAGASLVATLDRLEGGGLIVRVRCDEDRRVRLIHLTNTGRDLYGKIRVQADRFSVAKLSHFDAAALGNATKFLETLADRIVTVSTNSRF